MDTAFDFRHFISQRSHKVLMGIINATPDSFSDGGECLDADDAILRGCRMIEEGADMLDVGGESTRPGFVPVEAEEEIRRVLPIIHALHQKFPQIPISVDTSKATVADAALKAGATVVNDISALEDKGMADVIRSHRAGCVLMHRAALEPQTSAIGALAQYFQERLQFALNATGLPIESFCIDPGIGFGKNDRQTADILGNLETLKNAVACPLLLGVSRKSFIARFCEEDLQLRERLNGSLAVAAYSYNGYDILRVHDVGAHRKFLEFSAPNH